jgi:hypothetical protein
MYNILVRQICSRKSRLDSSGMSLPQEMQKSIFASQKADFTDKCEANLFPKNKVFFISQICSYALVPEMVPAYLAILHLVLQIPTTDTVPK